jgi:PAS domain S-box-containing protein
MQQAGDSIVLFDNTGHILEANESALDLLGYSSNEYKKIPLKDIFFEEDLKEKPLQFDLLNKGESTINRRRLKRKDGTGVETEAHAKMLSDGRYIVVVRNLTERIKAEQKLFEKDQQLREISSSIPGLIYQFVLEPTGEFHFPFISESAKALIEVSPAEVYENVANAFAKVHPDDLPGLYESIYVSAKTLTPWLYVFKISGVADQSNKWIRGSSIPKKMENGSILWNGAMFDITELKIAEEQIRDKENRFRSLIDTAPDATIIMDENGIIRIANLQAESLFGYTKAELTGISVEILMPESFRKQHSSHQKQILEKTNAREMEAGRELVAVKKDGSLVPVEMSLSPFHSDEEILVTASIRDITERKNAEKELEESYKSIRRLTEYLQEVREEERTYIAREIHDELGQQLTVMMMDVAWLNKKIGTENVGVSDKIKELLEMLDNTVKTVRRISTELRPSVLDDLGLVPAIEMHLKDFETRSAILTQLTVPKQDLELADPVKNTLFRIFQESLTNVARHSGAKKVVVKLEVENNIIVLIIEDNGIGFDEQKAATKRTLGVLGMKERAAVIGGEYHISGKRGKGTIIQVKVPLHN